MENSRYGTTAMALAVPSGDMDSKISSLPRLRAIICETRYINGGLDLKFEADPFNITLHGIMNADEYSASMRDLNDRLLQARSTLVDKFLLATGAALLPLIPFALRKKKNSKLRRRIIDRFCDDFNRQHPALLIRWQTRPFKQLMIFNRTEAEVEINR